MFTRTLTDADELAWNAALEKCQVSHHAFSWQWRSIIRKAFGHQSRYLLAESDSGDVALLPLIHFKSPLFGEALISMPYLNAGGVVATSTECRQAVLAEVQELARNESVKYIELRHNEVLNSNAGWSESGTLDSFDDSRAHKVTMCLELPSDPEELFTSFPPKLRSQIRRPTKSGLYSESYRGEDITSRQIDEFYSVFAEHMRDLGTPVYPKSLFSATCRLFGESCRLILVKNNRRAVAVGLTVGAGVRSEILWASALRQFNKQSPNMLLYWDAIKGAVQDGYRVFDFGRSSPDSGTFRFKKQWGAQPEILRWHYKLYRGEMPDVNPSSPKFQFLVSCWKHLPLPLANTVGPFITRGLP